MVRIGRFINGFLKYLRLEIVRTDKRPGEWHHSTSPDIIHSSVHPWATYSPWLSDSSFQDIFKSLKDFTLVDIYRMWELWVLAGQLENVPGDVLEVGVWKGGTGALIASRLKHTGRTIFLADTFTGVVKAGERDSVYINGEHSDVTFNEVKRLVLRMGLENVSLLEGVFPEDTGHLVLGPLALVHIDVDVYQSGKDVLEFVVPLLSPGAFIIFDDYGFSGCEGITTLVNELADSPRWTFFHNLNGHAIFILK